MKIQSEEEFLDLFSIHMQSVSIHKREEEAFQLISIQTGGVLVAYSHGDDGDFHDPKFLKTNSKL